MIRTFPVNRICYLASVFLLASIALYSQAVNSGGTFGSVISLNGSPSDMLLDELRQRLYLANSTANRVDILDLNTRRIVKSIPTGTYPLSLALSVDSNSLFVTNTQIGRAHV